MAVTRKRKASAATPKVQSSVSPVTKLAANNTYAKASRVEYKDDDPFYAVLNESSDSAGESDVSDYEGRKRRKKMTTKTKKRNFKKKAFSPGPAPEAPEMSDNEYDISDEEDFSTVKQAGINSIVSTGTKPGVLNIQIPALRSPANLNLNLGDLLAQVGVQLNLRSPATPISITSPESTPPAEKTSKEVTGFLKLPQELRDKVYRNAFVASAPIIFHLRDNFQRSAHFLATCRTVAAEGAAILYGENSFHFSRTADKRGSYHEKVWKEIGYKDVRRFLNDIGPVNISNLKYVSLELEDAAPYLTTYLAENAERAYVNDPVLLEIFSMIGSNTVLSKLAISFSGRAQVHSKDIHFLRALSRVKCHEFYHANNYRDRIEDKAMMNLKTAMVRVKEDAENIDEKKVKNVPAMHYEKPKKDDFTKSW